MPSITQTHKPIVKGKQRCLRILGVKSMLTTFDYHLKVWLALLCLVLLSIMFLIWESLSYRINTLFSCILWSCPSLFDRNVITYQLISFRGFANPNLETDAHRQIVCGPWQLLLWWFPFWNRTGMPRTSSKIWCKLIFSNEEPFSNIIFGDGKHLNSNSL